MVATSDTNCPVAPQPLLERSRLPSEHGHRTGVEQEMDDDGRQESMRLPIEVAQAKGQEEQRNPVRSMRQVQYRKRKSADGNRPVRNGVSSTTLSRGLPHLSSARFAVAGQEFARFAWHTGGGIAWPPDSTPRWKPRLAGVPARQEPHQVNCPARRQVAPANLGADRETSTLRSPARPTPPTRCRRQSGAVVDSAESTRPADVSTRTTAPGQICSA